MEILIVIGVIAFCYFAVASPDWQIDGAMKRARKRQEKQILREAETPRWTEEELALIHPDAAIVGAVAQRLGNSWHVVLFHMDVEGPDPPITERELFLACTGQRTEPYDIIVKAPTHDALHYTITCPDCRATMNRVYAINNQPRHADFLHPQQMQLLLTPEMVNWDVSRLHPSPEARKRKKKQAW